MLYYFFLITIFPMLYLHFFTQIGTMPFFIQQTDVGTTSITPFGITVKKTLRVFMEMTDGFSNQEKSIAWASRMDTSRKFLVTK